MEQKAAAETLCEVCAKPTARRGDLLCGDCSRAFTIMLDLLRRHPEVDVQDLDRMREVFRWRIEKSGAPMSAQIEAGVRNKEVLLPAAPPSLPREQTKAACEVCAKPLVETDYLLCSDCSRAFTIVLDLLRESAPLVQGWLDAHPELTAEDLNRIKQVFTWRSSRMGLRKPEAKVGVPMTS
jgi:uncharacterized protein YbaR (Trm112 family)